MCDAATGAPVTGGGVKLKKKLKLKNTLAHGLKKTSGKRTIRSAAFRLRRHNGPFWKGVLMRREWATFSTLAFPRGAPASGTRLCL